LPEIIAKHVKGRRALDFGCGTGRSARFLKRLNFEVTGVDISPDMLGYARELDPSGEYLLVTNGSYSYLGEGSFDLILSIFTFDNIPGWENRILILKALTNLLTPAGKLICLDANPELYTNEWASFSTLEFPGNRYANNGDIVRIVMKDVEDMSPVEDILWTESAYHRLFDLAGLTIEATYKPLGLESDPCNWLMESSIAPWFIFVMKKRS
jgi:ubiquinone/menaquinone biosynthesis C-methylase UbiE